MKSMTSFFLFTLTIISLIIGIILDSWSFLILAISIFSILAVESRGVLRGEVRLKVERKSEKMSLYEDDEIWIELSVKNEGRPLNYLEIFDSLPSDIDIVEGSNHQILRLDEKEEKTLRYKIHCSRRGEMEIGPIKFRYRDPLNFHVEEWTSYELMNIFVLPEVQNMQSVDVRPLYTKSWIGNIKSQRMGIGSEFFSLREYMPDDALKKINWKASARFLEPMTNEFVGERTGDVILVVDGYRKNIIGDDERNTLDATIRAAGTLASSILEDRNRVGLIILGDYLRWLYPDSGRDHFYKIMEELSGVREGGHWELQDAKWVLRDFFPNRSMIVFISPLLSKEISETLFDICMQEYNVMVISPNPLVIQKEIMKDHNILAEKLSQLNRDVILDKLWKYSIVVDWDPNEPLEASLEEVIRYWQRK
ncbi:MAG: DUF58 domain-containing protein [Candidatus Thermoplasmatota archaeon]|nr:DUF58 domain-containing protein [Candidatus Thermoplasmatota archaeon]MBS3790729.1 DUF58 domain-containing protein [Candidatus Thermoplasmatota archaeon]